MIDSILGSFNLILNWRKSNREEREAIAHYLEKMADDADTLAAVWTDVIREVRNNVDFDLMYHDGARKFVNRPLYLDDSELFMMNAVPLSRIEAFAESIPYTLDGEYRDEGEHMHDIIVSLLRLRDALKLALERQTSIEREDQKELSETILKMNKHAAQIRVCAYEIRIK